MWSCSYGRPERCADPAARRSSEVTGLGIEPRTYGLRVPPGLDSARFPNENSGQLVHHSGVLVWARNRSVPLFVPLPWNGQNVSVLAPFPDGWAGSDPANQLNGETTRRVFVAGSYPKAKGPTVELADRRSDVATPERS